MNKIKNNKMNDKKSIVIMGTSIFILFPLLFITFIKLIQWDSSIAYYIYESYSLYINIWYLIIILFWFIRFYFEKADTIWYLIQGFVLWSIILMPSIVPLTPLYNNLISDEILIGEWCYNYFTTYSDWYIADNLDKNTNYINYYKDCFVSEEWKKNFWHIYYLIPDIKQHNYLHNSMTLESIKDEYIKYRTCEWLYKQKKQLEDIKALDCSEYYISFYEQKLKTFEEEENMKKIEYEYKQDILDSIGDEFVY